MDKKLYNLTNPQKSIWLTEQFYSNTAVNNLCCTVSINSVVDFNLLNKALNIFFKNNDGLSLRIFIDENGEVKQYLNDYKDINFKINEINNTDELIALEKKIVSVPFSIIDNDLFEIQLYKLPNGFGGFIANAHHLISDACTATILGTKVTNIYFSLLKNEEITEDSSSYFNYINSEISYLNSDKFNKDKEYWSNILNTIPETASLSTMPDSSVPNSKCIRESFTISSSKLKEITEFCKSNTVSVFNFLMSIYSIYIGKSRNLKNFVIGSPILNRTNFKDKHTPGMFISTVPFVFDMSNNLTSIDFISNVAVQTTGIFRHQKYPYQYILEDLREQHGPIHNLYNVMISYQNSKIEKNSNDLDYSVKWVPNDNASDELDIHIFDMNDVDYLNVAYDYQISKYSKEDIDNIHKRILYIIEQVINNKDLYINDIEIILPEEKRFILDVYNDCSKNLKIDSTVVSLFETQVESFPNNIAICDDNCSVTYSELNNISNNICDFLIKKGVKPNDRVCLFFNNSIDLVASILAVLKSGACYIPIDVSYPTNRIDYIIKDSNCRFILTNKVNYNKIDIFSELSLMIDYNTYNYISDSNYNLSNLYSLAYIIYTSGSTGNPKGVQICHESLSNYIVWANNLYVNNEVTSFPLYSSISFDLTVTSIYAPLISGNVIYIYANNDSGLLLYKIIEDKKANIIKLTPAHLSLLLDIDLPCHITKFIVGGDILNIELCKKICDKYGNDIFIFNEYGPTEATVGCMTYLYSKDNCSNYSSVPIGIPASNCSLYVLNDNLNLIPFNYPGELYISGKCLSKGYVNLDDVNNKSFIPSPFSSTDLLYKTGDIVKLDCNGIMEYIGRDNSQIQLNGFRIEISEIQSKILSFPNIKDCFVDVFDSDNSKVLIAYYSSTEFIDLNSLKNFLKNSLPSYMIPKSYIYLDSIPLTNNGKVDKSNLPIPKFCEYETFESPSNELEVLIHNTFCSLLNIQKMNVIADFSDYYIDSLIIIKAQTVLHSKGISINNKYFYEYPNIRSLCNFINNGFCDIKSNISIPSVEDIVVPNEIKSKEYKNILIFGSTGFLGMHLLYNILKNSSSNVYCIVRDKDNIDYLTRFINKFNFYFNSDEFDFYKDRIFIMHGNISDDNFGLCDEDYDLLKNNVDCIIDSAAIVKHYGSYEYFYKTNVNGTIKVIDFCINFKIPLHYISTMSVSGYGLVKVPKSIFTENDFYVGQSFEDNVYVKSKFEAEALILNACKNNNLIASIYRVGNITNRFSDGVFQENSNENAFLNRISSIINLGMITDDMKNISLEFTPVDILSNFIINLINVCPNNINIYHLYNNNTLSFSNLINLLKTYNINIQTVCFNEFEEKLLNNPDKYFGITNYLSNIDFNNLVLYNNFTNSVLSTLGLSWPSLDNTYIFKFISYLTKNNYIGGLYEK